MRRTYILAALGALLATTLLATADDKARDFTFRKDDVGGVPANWKADKTGTGEGSVWKVVADGTAPSKSFCYRVENSKAISTPLQIGLRFDGLVEVLKKQTKPGKSGEKGLWEDFTGTEDIVQGNLGLLSDGQEVRVVPGDKPKGEGAPKPEAQGTAELKVLTKARLEAARKAYEEAVKASQQTRREGTLMIPLAKSEEVYTWSVRWLNAQRDVSSKKDEQIVALEDHLKRMKELAQRVARLREGGLVSSLEPLATESYRVEAELWLAQEKTKK